MRIEIKDFCIRCGLCQNLYPELFKLNFAEDRVDVMFNEIPEKYHEHARGAAADCAVTCIFIKK